MITEEMLALAAGEVSAAMVACVEDVPHVFSRGFERKLHRLNRRAEHPVRYQVLRHVAAVLIAVITVFGALFAASPTVRAAVIGWVKSIINRDIQYTTDETLPSNIQYHYGLSDDDGYILLTTIDSEGERQYIYAAPDGTMMTFFYSHSADSVLHLYDITHYSYYSGFVDKCPADIYIAPTIEETSVIVWQNYDQNMIFCISASGDQEKLIELAKKVEIIKN